MRTTNSYIRIIVFVSLSFWLLARIIAPESLEDALSSKLFWSVLGLMAVLMIAAEVILEAIRTMMLQVLSEEAKERYYERQRLLNQNRFAWLKKFYISLTKSKPIDQESEIIIDHDYDGIKELDNRLPPWWVYGFYATIIFGAIYLTRFQVLGAPNQEEEYQIAVIEAKAEIEAYRETAKDFIDVNTVVLLTEQSDLDSGSEIFIQKCAICHKNDGGGGIGPNLTDKHWILGGGIKNVFQTVSEGGRAGKGMIPWKSELRPHEIAQVSSFILTSLVGTSPAEPKAAEGDIWQEQDQ